MSKKHNNIYIVIDNTNSISINRKGHQTHLSDLKIRKYGAKHWRINSRPDKRLSIEEWVRHNIETTKDKLGMIPIPRKKEYWV